MLVDVKQLILDGPDLLSSLTIPAFPSASRLRRRCFAACATRTSSSTILRSFHVMVQFLKQAARPPWSPSSGLSTHQPQLAHRGRAVEAAEAAISYRHGRAQALRRGGRTYVGARHGRAGSMWSSASPRWPRQDLPRRPARGRGHAQLCPFRDRQLSSGYGTPLYRSLLLHLRSPAGRRCGRRLQLHDRLCRAALPRQAGAGAADLAPAHRRADRGRDHPCPGEPARGDLAEAQRPGGSRHHRQAL